MIWAESQEKYLWPCVRAICKTHKLLLWIFKSPYWPPVSIEGYDHTVSVQKDRFQINFSWVTCCFAFDVHVQVRIDVSKVRNSGFSFNAFISEEVFMWILFIRRTLLHAFDLNLWTFTDIADSFVKILNLMQESRFWATFERTACTCN